MAKKANKYSHTNPVIQTLIEETKKEIPTILDVGCWNGALGLSLKKDRFHCVIDGIDIEKNILIKSKGQGYREVYQMDLHYQSLSKIKKTYDLVILGDILEHLIDPEKVLKESAKRLSKNGHIIVSLPNIGFIKYRLLHLIGKWNYTETGIMDKTHLHFYTLKTMRELFSRSNLVIESFIGFSAVPKVFWFIKILGETFPSLFALQVIFKLKTR